MLRLLFVILFVSSLSVQGQELPETAAEALTQYISLRDGYKHSSSKQFSRTEQLEMDDWCYAMQKKFPNAYEMHYAWYVNGHFYDDEKDHLMEAYKLAPSDSKVLKAVFGFYMMKNEVTSAKGILSKVAALYSSNELNYYKDLAPSSGVIIVSSNQEAIPLYVLQLKGSISSNVEIINMDYLLNTVYHGSKASLLKTGESKFGGNESNYLKTALSGSQNVSLSTTVSQAYLASNADHYFVTGLSYQYEPIDQTKSLEAFWQKVKLRNFSSLSLSGSDKKLYMNYLPPLLTLYHLKNKQGNQDAQLKQGILILADKVGKKEEVTKILGEYD